MRPALERPPGHGRLRLLDLYLIREMALPYAIGVSALVLMLLGDALYFLISYALPRGIDLVSILRYLVLKVPTHLVVALPVATLLAGALAINRLSRDSELTAFRMGGVRLTRILTPVMAVGAAMSGLTFAVAEYLAPWTNHLAEGLARQVFFRQPAPIIRENVFFQASQDYYVYVRRLDPITHSLWHVMIYEVRPDGFPIITTARRGHYRDQVWVLEEGIQHIYEPDGRWQKDAQFRQATIDLREAWEAFWPEVKTPAEMSAEELKRQMGVFQKGGIDVRSMALEYHSKFAIPMACLVFVLLAGPLSLRFSRGGSFVGILLTIALAFAYKVLMAWSRALGEQGVIPPMLAAWSQNLIFGSLGLFLLLRQE